MFRKLLLVVFSFFVLFFLAAQPVRAFFSPSTLQLVAYSITGYSLHLVVIFFAWIGYFFVRIKRIYKIIIGLSLFALLLAVTTNIFSEFTDLKRRNIAQERNLEYGNFLEDKEKMRNFLSSYEQLEGRLEKLEIDWDEKELQRRYIDLNDVDPKTLEGFFKINLLCQNKNTYLKDSIFLCFEEALDLVREGRIEEFLAENGIQEGDKTLFYCYMGATSQRIAYLFSLMGYDAYYTLLYTLDDDKMLNFGFTKADAAQMAIITKGLRESDIPNSKFIHFIFNIDDEAYINDVFIDLFPDNLEMIVVDEQVTFPGISSLSKLKFIDSLEETDPSAKILCTSNLNCLVTKHYLYFLGIKKHKFIYQFDYLVLPSS